ncbi:MAG: hypothetical protein LBM87_05190 [Ruminococcus sp.]|jgi:hypothetical protein|nr:hypothetical protein [Ruminococcus sp.]
MTDNFSEQKWNQFEATGKISDYLEFKGVKNFSDKTCSESGTKTPIGVGKII